MSNSTFQPDSQQHVDDNSSADQTQPSTPNSTAGTEKLQNDRARMVLG